MKIESTGYWTFFCNPAKWEIDKFLETNIDDDTYQIMEWQESYFNIGQLGIIRVGNDTRPKKVLGGRRKLLKGVYAIVEIISKPRMRNKKPDKYWLGWTENELKKPVVEIRYLKNLLNNPLYLSSIKKFKEIQTDKYLVNGFQASSMPLKKESFNKILSLADSNNTILNNIENVDANNLNQIKDLESKYANATPEVKEVISKRIERGRIAEKIKKLNDYKCQVCETLGRNPYTFNKLNGEYYVESHHILSVSKLFKGVLSSINIITVCANHHRQIHYGNVDLIENNNQFVSYKIDEDSIKIIKRKL